MILDIGTTSYMAPKNGVVQHQDSCDVIIRLADDSFMPVSQRGIRNVECKTKEGQTNFCLSDILNFPKLSMSLLFVPALAKKNISTIFIFVQAVLIDIENDLTIFGGINQARNGLFSMKISRALTSG